MSRGPGRIERAIEAAFQQHPTTTFSAGELCLISYPGINQPEKRHRVSVIRAADKVAPRLHWRYRHAERPGGENVYFNLLNVRSYALGKLRCTSSYVRLADLEERVDNPDAYRSEWARCQPGGVWWRHVEIHRADIAGDADESSRLQEELKGLVLKGSY
ncbi:MULTISPECIES: hypothetical protein [Methylosinus]|uniref:Uncharacterized protein n=1 Tax=Methylosinus trichosporium (strain ATCC 35070 / NCIMB 11131 / UNIQEM 75 / OB3b) TaxID=595536 RepID=A0A2D2CXI1_METT3|nr:MULTISPECIES: hypothetical protein [Methylosinus]ATQ67413.1 hypothetical protein CQW49_05520 [Methylosinus trichosporium OB3b]OBS51576.1 hypothetical protein A8B73_15275 [Methylosinus sp. 3S-1]